jgi:diguanylate cyclase (GGDEF)-like protein
LGNNQSDISTPQEDVLIRRLLLADRFLWRNFEPDLEAKFWDFVDSRTIHSIEKRAIPVLITYTILGLVSLPFVHLFGAESFRPLELYNAIYIYLVGAICLTILTVLSRRLSNRKRLHTILSIAAFTGIFSTAYFSLQFHTAILFQAATYDVILAYILVYFLLGLKPRSALLIGLSAGLLALIIAYLQTASDGYVRYSNQEIILYLYYIGLINFIGYIVGYANTAKERENFLQARLLALDKATAERMGKELVRLTREDSMTGLANRRFFNERMSDEWGRARRSGEPLSLIFVDIDHFKAYNDHYGHLKGDDTLIAVAHGLQQVLARSTDLAARYGGEEFVILLPNTPIKGARAVADRVLHVVDSLNIQHKKSLTEKHVTVSIGVSTCSIHEEDLTIAEFVQQADNAVYKAKSAGRHRIREHHLIKP